MNIALTILKQLTELVKLGHKTEFKFITDKKYNEFIVEIDNHYIDSSTSNDSICSFIDSFIGDIESSNMEIIESKFKFNTEKSHISITFGKES